MRPAKPRDYQELLEYIEIRLNSIRRKYAGQIQCKRGCARCCLGLFDISLPDALRVAEGFCRLPRQERIEVAARASILQDRIVREASELREPYLLDLIPQERIDRIADLTQDDRCPFLSASDSCMIYEHRPLACLLEGIPMVDLRDGLFDDWCRLNFTWGVSCDMEAELSMDYYKIQKIERDVTGELSKRLFGRRREECTIFIPSVIVMMRESESGIRDLFLEEASRLPTGLHRSAGE